MKEGKRQKQIGGLIQEEINFIFQRQPLGSRNQDFCAPEPLALSLARSRIGPVIGPER